MRRLVRKHNISGKGRAICGCHKGRPTIGRPATTKERMNAAAEAVASDSDRSLAELVLGGDEPAFRLLYQRHTPRLFLLVLPLLGGSEADAGDGVQETWAKAT